MLYIGLFILCLIGLILILLLLILYAPIRYKVTGVFTSKEEGAAGEDTEDNTEEAGEAGEAGIGYDVLIKCRWLLFVAVYTVKISDTEGSSSSFRILGIPVDAVGILKSRFMGGEAEAESEAVVRTLASEDNEATGEPAAADQNSDDDQEPATDKKSDEDKKPATDKKSAGKRSSKKKRSKEKTDSESITDKIKLVFNKIKTLYTTIKKVRNDPAYPDGVAKLKAVTIKTLKHIKPKKILADMVIGTGDPCNTGYLFGGISVVMAMWPGDYRLVPDFYDKRIEGKAYAKGRIRVGILLYYLVELLADKNIKRLLRIIKYYNRS